MYDLYTPSDRYDEEVVKLKKTIGEIDDNKEFVSIDLTNKTFDRQFKLYLIMSY